MSAPLLTAQALAAGWQQAVTPPLDLCLVAGEIVGLTGPNGIGKSTFLAALGGRARIHAGTLQQRSGLRLVWQTQDIPPVAGLPLCGCDLLGLTGASASGLPDWLADKLGWRLDRLSGGQRHYLALWAILQAPSDLILLDEPTNNLDPAGVEHLTLSMRLLRDKGVGLLVVSHDQDFVDAVCDRTIHFGENRK